MIAIHEMTVRELPLCEPLARSFFEEMRLPGVFSMDSFTKNWTVFLATPGYTAAIFGLWKDGALIGALGALMAPDLHTGQPTANELFWFVSMEHRHGSGALRLVKQFEQWAHQHGATDFRLVHLLGPNGERFPKIYEHLGYRPIEINYLKPNPNRKEG